VVLSACTGEERGRTAELRALLDLDLVAPRDASVAREMDGDRTGRRSRRGILVDAVTRNEDARLPRVAVEGDARSSVRVQILERREVGPKRGDRSGRVELDDDVSRALEIRLDRRQSLDAEQLEKLHSARERLVRERRLLHPAEQDARAVALEPHRHDAGVA